MKKIAEAGNVLDPNPAPQAPILGTRDVSVQETERAEREVQVGWQILKLEPGACYIVYATNHASLPQVRQAMVALRDAFRGSSNPPMFTLFSGPIAVMKDSIGSDDPPVTEA